VGGPGDGVGGGVGAGPAGQSLLDWHVFVGALLHFPPGPTHVPQSEAEPHLL
jgi:hypothetical protein